MPNEPKIRAGRLESGDEILVVKDGKHLAMATMKRDSFVAVVLRIEKKPPPKEGLRGGYAVYTDRGEIPFVTGVAAFIRANDADWIRTRKNAKEDKREPVAVPDTLNGVRITPADRAAAVAPKAPKAPTRSAEAAFSAPAVPAPAAPAPAAARAARDAAKFVTAKGPAAVANYLAQAKASTTDRARDWWTAKAQEARS